ncbi:MAG: peptidoglycan DD-metalloendopeptidase family protein [Dokdonella sp.]
MVRKHFTLACAVLLVAAVGSSLAIAAPSSYRADFGPEFSQGAFLGITSDHTIGIDGYAIAADRKGRLLVATEWSTSNVLGNQCAVTRYSKNARILDMDFTGSGATGSLEGTQRVTLGLPGTSFDHCTSLAVDSSSRPVIGGYANTLGGTPKSFLIRLTDSGYDTGFGNNGRFRIDTAASTFLTAETRFTDIRATSASRTLACGFVQRPGGRNMLIARILSSGSLDTAFNGTGYNEIAFDTGGSNDDECTRVIEQPDGKIVVVGNVSTSSNGSGIGVSRLLSNGALDTSFSSDGKYVVGNTSQISVPSVTDVAYDTTRARYLIASTLISSTFDPTALIVAVRDSAGLDTSFGDAGRLAFRFSSLGGRAAGGTSLRRLLLQDDGGFYVAGTHDNTGSDAIDYGANDAAIARFLANGTVDTRYSVDGVAYYGTDSPSYSKVPENLRTHIGDTLKDAMWYDGSVVFLTDTNRFPAGNYGGKENDLGPSAPMVSAIVTESLFSADFDFDGLPEPETEPPLIPVPNNFGHYCSAHQPGNGTVFGLGALGYDSDPCQAMLNQNPALVIDRDGLWSLNGKNNAIATCSGNFIALETGNGSAPLNAIFADTAGRTYCVFTISPQNLPVFDRPYTGNHLPADQPAQSFNHNGDNLDGINVSEFGQTPVSGHLDAHNIDLFGRQRCYKSGGTHVVTGGVDEVASDIGIQNDRQVLSVAVGRVASAVPRLVTLFTPTGNDPWQREVFVRHHVGLGRYSEQFTTYYAHMSNTAVRRGDVIAAGTVLGQVGDTGAANPGPGQPHAYHLHLGVIRNRNLNFAGTFEFKYADRENFEYHKYISAMNPWGWRAPNGAIDPWAWRFRDFDNSDTGVWSINLWKTNEEPTIN